VHSCRVFSGAVIFLLAFACKDLSSQARLQPDVGPGAPAEPLQQARLPSPSLLEAGPFEQAVQQLKRAVTGGKKELAIEALELRALPNELVLQAEDPKTPGRVLMWKYSNGKVQDPVVVELKGTGNLKENLFTLDGVYLQAVPRLSSLAVDHVDPQDGRVTHIVVRRNLPFSSDVRFRVFVQSPRRNGQLDANRFGHPLLG
jgi:hypothetical protein